MVTGGLRERSKARRRQAITQAAYRLFAEQGYSGTSIADIAAEAEVSPRTVTLYFPSKQDIALSRFSESVQRLTDAFRARTEGVGALDVLTDWLHDENRQRDPQDELAERMFDANPELQALRTARLAEALREGTAAVAEDLGVSPQSVGPRIAAAAAMAVMTVLHDVRFSDTEWERTLATALDFLKAGIQTLGNPQGGSSA
ncbi:TetR/AcrR family transcriptional regulator [Streptomyces sp. NPDC059629]|uniref:TetR/AcrR family transcriptional regulator n=1 Tax=Streptomyces sp. NPDC059629 TaxID=3346889 RepID=UPI00368CB82C